MPDILMNSFKSLAMNCSPLSEMIRGRASKYFSLLRRLPDHLNVEITGIQRKLGIGENSWSQGRTHLANHPPEQRRAGIRVAPRVPQLQNRDHRKLDRWPEHGDR